MQGLIEFITEDKNTHREHLEDEIINNIFFKSALLDTSFISLIIFSLPINNL